MKGPSLAPFAPRAGWLGIHVALMLGACASPRTLPVRVNAMSRPGYNVDKGAALCISVEKAQKAAPKLVEQVLTACRRAARRQGLRAVEPSEQGTCLHARLRWYGEPRPGTRAADRCEEIFGAAFCRRSDPHLFGKALAIDLVDTNREPPLKIHDVKASLATRNPGFNDATAEALCEGAFRQFPMRRMNTLYEIEM